MMPGGACSKASPKIVAIEVAPHHLDILQGPVRHQIGQKANRVRQGLFRRLEPDHVRREAQQIGIVRKRLYCCSGRALMAFNVGNFAGSVFCTASLSRLRTSMGSPAKLKSHPPYQQEGRN